MRTLPVRSLSLGFSLAALLGAVALAQAPSPEPVRARNALGLAGTGPATPSACASGAAGLRCLVDRFYDDDETARADALALFDRHGVVAGVEAAWIMDGGFRGTLELVPERAVRRHARHLRWVREAHDAIAALFSALAPHATRPIRYRHEGIVYAFFRSVGRTTPSAYASQWHVGYNVSGSLHRNADAVRGTLVHEIFHLNDEADDWTGTRLRAIHARILARCGTSPRCLAPYAPTPLRVRGGTYYAFQPNNGDAVNEYGADLASRWFEEQRTMVRGGRLAATPWKCLTRENAEAYASIADAFFGGVDRTPPCRR